MKELFVLAELEKEQKSKNGYSMRPLKIITENGYDKNKQFFFYYQIIDGKLIHSYLIDKNGNIIYEEKDINVEIKSEPDFNSYVYKFFLKALGRKVAVLTTEQFEIFKRMQMLNDERFEKWKRDLAKTIKENIKRKTNNKKPDININEFF